MYILCNFRFVLYLTTGCEELSRDKQFCADLEVFSRTVLAVWKKGSRKRVYKDKNKVDFQIMIGEKQMPSTKEVRAIVYDEAIQKKVCY